MRACSMTRWNLQGPVYTLVYAPARQLRPTAMSQTASAAASARAQFKMRPQDRGEVLEKTAYRQVTHRQLLVRTRVLQY